MCDTYMFQNSSNFPLEQFVTCVKLHDTGISNMLMLSTLPSSPCCGDVGSTEPLNVFSAAAQCPLICFSTG